MTNLSRDRSEAMKKPFYPSTAALAIAFAGCGDEDDSEPASGPATVIPADMPLYIEATVKPEGEQAENLDALLAELADLPLPGIDLGDPGDLIVSQLESQAADAGVDFSYAEDVEPWLGEKAGFGIAEDADERDTGSSLRSRRPTRSRPASRSMRSSRRTPSRTRKTSTRA